MGLTHGQRINELQPADAIVIDKIAGGGSLEARRLRTGSVMFYWRYTERSKTARIPIGIYDPSAPPKKLVASPLGYSVAAALESARVLAKQNRDLSGGLKAERARQHAAALVKQRAELAKAKLTLRALCNDYCDWLQKSHKVSHADARGIFENHLLSAYPELADLPAAQVEKRAVVKALRRLTEEGKNTTARKLRAYLRAAFACALKADSDSMLPTAFLDYGVTANPVEATAAIKGQSDKNPLSATDMRRYWRALRDEPGVIGAALRLHLLSGAQRTAQLVRLQAGEVGADSFKILDPKGKRSHPRVHLLPLTDPMRTEIRRLPDTGFVMSTDGGATRAGIEDFQLKRVRSGVETMLAEAGVSLHTRGQLQSHGVGGVQERNYDAYEYLPEKLQALRVLMRALEPASGPAKSDVGKTASEKPGANKTRGKALSRR
jgi:hypothetical protein